MLSQIPAVIAQNVVHFHTNAGNFVVTLNPTGNSDLQPYVDNFLAYVNSDRYDNTVINRAAGSGTEEFVIQWGSYKADVTTTDQLGIGGFSSIESFDPVIVDADNNGKVDFDTTGLDNTLGTVSFALSTGPNTATSSIFVNLKDNSFLNDEDFHVQGFVPFAVINDLTVINSIASLPTENLASQIGTSSGNFHYADIPIIGEDEFVIVTRATANPEESDLNIDDFIDEADLDILLGNWDQMVTSDQGELAGTSLVDGLDLGVLLGAWNPDTDPSSLTQTIPEPSGLMLLALGTMSLAARYRLICS